MPITNSTLIFNNTTAPFDLRESYDFIIVGSGPAGCVLANRLTENPAINVLLLEAGSRPTTLHSIPALASYAVVPETSWGYQMSPHPGSCLGYKGQTCAYPLGRVLGGSSAVNYMVYVRGSRHDFDRWEEMGNYGWGFDDVLPLFLKMENATSLRHQSLDTDFRGVRGELDVSHTHYRSLLGATSVQAAKERGLPYLDFNGKRQIGVDYLQGTTRNGRRFSAANAYLDPIQGRKNLHVMLNSLVSKVIIDPATKVTLGVEYIYQGRTHRVMANKEVILSAGPINSPQLLWLSGVGPKRDLTKFNIPVLSDLPVGEKYLDHTSFGRISISTDTWEDSIDLSRINSKDVDDFVFRGAGKLTVPATMEVVTMQNNGYNNNIPQENANMEMIMITGKHSQGTAGYTGMRDDVYNATFKPVDESPYGVISIFIVDLYPETQGRLRMRGPTINHMPIIDFPFFKSTRDMEALVWGAKEAVALLSTKAMKDIGGILNSLPIPDCASLVFGSDEYWRCYIRHLARNILHAAATNKMGPKNDIEAVVDPELRVYGIAKLRVADSSVAPTTVACHTQAVSYVVGEKLSELLKKDWGI